MTPELLVTLVGSCLSAGALIVVAMINRDAKRSAAKADERQARREREARLSMEVMAATLDLADVIAIAVSGGKTNGNVEEARRKAAEARAAYMDFLRDEAARAVAK